MQQARITAIHVYPVKSMRGIALEQVELTPKGLRHDRRWMVVRPGGRFVTQRDEPRLALVQTRLEADGVTLAVAGHGSHFLPFESGGGPPIRSRVWGDEVETEDEGDEASRWLNAAIGSDAGLRLVRMAAGFRRAEAPAGRFGNGTTVDFADAAPLLVTFEGSLQALNRALQAGGHGGVPMDRFRPNIVIAGPPPFSEHALESLSGDGWTIALVDHCERCMVPTVNQQTAERDPDREPYMTLRRINPVPGEKPAPGFGVNARIAAGAGQVLQRGAAVTLS